MKQKARIALLIGLALCLMTTSVMASGGKVRGDNGQGEVYQQNGEPPFAVRLNPEGTFEGSYTDIGLGGLDVAEVNDLLSTREQVKLTEDVSTVMYEKWGLQVFDAVVSDSQKQGKSLQSLISSYGLEDPYIAEQGNYTNENLEVLYKGLIEQGLRSQEDALLVGALLKELNVSHSWQSEHTTDDARLMRQYKRLYQDAYDHLNEFVYTYQKLSGKSYTNQYLGDSQFQYVRQKGKGK